MGFVLWRERNKRSGRVLLGSGMHFWERKEHTAEQWETTSVSEIKKQGDREDDIKEKRKAQCILKTTVKSELTGHGLAVSYSGNSAVSLGIKQGHTETQTLFLSSAIQTRNQQTQKSICKECPDTLAA